MLAFLKKPSRLLTEVGRRDFETDTKLFGLRTLDMFPTELAELDAGTVDIDRVSAFQAMQIQKEAGLLLYYGRIPLTSPKTPEKPRKNQNPSKHTLPLKYQEKADIPIS